VPGIGRSYRNTFIMGVAPLSGWTSVPWYRYRCKSVLWQRASGPGGAGYHCRYVAGNATNRGGARSRRLHLNHVFWSNWSRCRGRSRIGGNIHRGKRTLFTTLCRGYDTNICVHQWLWIWC
jgi:hypothetical protein